MFSVIFGPDVEDVHSPLRTDGRIILDAFHNLFAYSLHGLFLLFGEISATGASLDQRVEIGYRIAPQFANKNEDMGIVSC